MSRRLSMRRRSVGMDSIPLDFGVHLGAARPALPRDVHGPSHQILKCPSHLAVGEKVVDEFGIEIDQDVDITGGGVFPAGDRTEYLRMPDSGFFQIDSVLTEQLQDSRQDRARV